MKQQKESIESVAKRAPKGATHYSYPEYFSNEVYWKMEDSIVESVWIPLLCWDDPENEFWYKDCGYWRTDYSDEDEQPYVEWGNLVELPKHTDSWHPAVGEIVMFKRNDSIDYAYDDPVKMEVVAVVGDKVWLKNAVRDLVTDLGSISPVKKQKSLREELVEILSCGGRENYPDADHAVDRLIRAGVKLEGRE